MIFVVEENGMNRGLLVEIIATYDPSLQVQEVLDVAGAEAALLQDPQLIVVGFGTGFSQLYPLIKEKKYVVVSAIKREGPGIDGNFIMGEDVVAELMAWLKQNLPK